MNVNFKKILVANRGEIACRIIRTAHDMGIKVVSVYSDADKYAKHVRMADEAIHIGPSPSSQSYLTIEKIIDAAKQTSAEAIHPGYGFLSENPQFVSAVEAAGLIFIGPSVHAIEMMGDKITSKKIAKEAGVSVVPGSKGAIRDIGKALALPKSDLEKVIKFSEASINSNLSNKMLDDIGLNINSENKAWIDLINLSMEIKGFPKYLAQHTSGMIISTSPISEMVPIQPAHIEGRYICQWDKKAIEQARFIKIDFLALGTLSQMQDILNLIERRTGEYIDLTRIDFTDSNVYSSMHEGDTIGIFQIESAAQIQTIRRIKPVNLVDMAYEVACVRPGVGVNDGVSQFIRRRNGEHWEFDHELERDALERTLGIILFQDQVNKLAMDVGGLTEIEADELRRALGWKRSESIINSYKKYFIAGANKKGVKSDVAIKIFEKFNGQYMFPESHAFAFGITAYHMAWLKYYYPLEFFVALFNQQPMGFYNLETLKEDAKRHNIIVVNPDINSSNVSCDIKEEKLLLGLHNI